ncbi:MAG: pilus assembly PilX N-terminal domain-containing protein [Acidaminococcaceae bacterium]
MHSNRGSAAVISIIFMMFLLIIGIGFMPLMSSEVKHASMDMDEQKAWYAAEAGIKYVKVYQTDAAEIKAILGTDINLSDDSNTAGYKLTMKDKTDSSAVTSATSGFPVEDKTYTVYSEGTSNGVKKVITGDFVFSTSSSSGGESGGGNTGNASLLPGLIHASSISISGGNLTGDLYAESMSGNSYATYNFNKQSSNYGTTLFTQISSSWFPAISQVKKAGYAQYVTKYGSEPLVTINSNSSYYIDSSSVIDWQGGINSNSISQVTGAAGAIVYVYDDMGTKIQSISGPASGVPFTVVLVNNSETTMGVNVYGRVRILSNKSLRLQWAGQSDGGKVMVMTNANLALNGWTVKRGFISANGDISISGGSFTGQIMAKGSVTIDSQNTTFNNEVLSDKDFWLPEWS